MLQVDPDARPRLKASAHRVHERVRRFQMRGDVGVTCFPTFETGECIRFFSGASNFDERVLWRASPRWCDTRAFADLFPVMRWPGGIAVPFGFLSRG